MGARVPASQGQNAKRSRNQAAEPPPQESISTPTNSKSVATTKETAEENQENYVKNKSLLYWTFAPQVSCWLSSLSFRTVATTACKLPQPLLYFSGHKQHLALAEFVRGADAGQSVAHVITQSQHRFLHTLSIQ